MNALLTAEFFSQPPVRCAARLIGMEFHWHGCAGIIVETEAYAAHGDEACHTFQRKGARAFVADHPAGTAYVYLNYGMHWLFNILVKGQEDGFVLLRALSPTRGVDIMQQRRKTTDPTALCGGPGRLTQALAIDGTAHGCEFLATRQTGILPQPVAGTILADRRIGISRAAEHPWRFLLAGSTALSRPPGPHARPLGGEIG